MPSYPKRPTVAKANLVHSFRGEQRSAPPLHPRESALVTVAVLHLVFLAWAMGGRTPWAQVVSLGFGVIAFVLAMLPRRYSGDLAPAGDFTLLAFPRLLRFPIFWLGLVFFAYVACQALNPAWFRANAGPYWWLAAKPHIEWLPSGVDAPFERMNAWRMLCFWGGAWLLACALWAGVTRRSAAHAVLVALVINGAVLALVGILQKVTSAPGPLWFIKDAPGYFVATFYYKNHGGAYFNLILVAALTLMLWHYVRGLRRLDRSSPAPVFAFGVIVLASIVFMSGSRASMLLLAAYAIVAVVMFFVWRSRSRDTAANPAVTGLLVVGSIGLVVAATWFLNLDKSIDQIRRLADQDHKGSIESRVIARQATMELHAMDPVTGWGAGSFRHAFPLAQRNHPEITNLSHTRLFWDHAHNDYVQALAELGWVGCVFPALMLLSMIWRVVRAGAFANPAYSIGFIGLGLPLAHAWMDFQLYNCAIFTTYVAIWVLYARWIELENAR